MNVTLSWDLVIIVFFAVVITYTFIIGKKESVKIIIATYISIIAVQGIGNAIQRLNAQTTSLLGNSSVVIDATVLSGIKLVLFVAIVVSMTIFAGFDLKYGRENGTVMNGVYTGLFGFATAGLFLSALLTYVAGLPLLDANLANVASLSPIIQQSQLMQVMIVNQDLWFALPAAILLGIGFMSNRA